MRTALLGGIDDHRKAAYVQLVKGHHDESEKIEGRRAVLKILNATGLKVGSSGKSNPFVVILINDLELKTTTKDGANPDWQESFPM